MEDKVAPQTYVKKAIKNVNEEIAIGNLERIEIYTSDHQQLDGCIVYADPNKKDTQRPVMLMAQGNFMTYEIAYHTAKAYAKTYECNVVLYNPRGVARILGKERSTQDAIKDCKAAIAFTLNRFCKDEQGQIDAKNLAVYGHSLGGGISATALKEMIQEQRLPDTGVGLYINHHSFSSLQRYNAYLNAWAKKEPN